jgi:hypothetical protein
MVVIVTEWNNATVEGKSPAQATPRPCLKTRRKGWVNGIFQSEL